MLYRMFSKLLFGVAFFMPHYCWAGVPYGQYPDYAKSTETTITVHIIWMPSLKSVNAICTFLMQSTNTVIGCYNPITHTIYAVEPTNFNDHFYLEILGHEFWHALGAEHPAL